MRRRALLAAVAGLPAGLAGCLASLGGTPTATPPVEAGVDLAPCPVLPSPLTAESVEPFVEQFERAFVGRRVLARVERVTSFGYRSLGVKAVTETDDGYRVRVRGYFGYSNYESATAVDDTHTDSGRYTVTYLVSESGVFRVEDGGEDSNPRTDGDRVRCPPVVENMTKIFN